MTLHSVAGIRIVLDRILCYLGDDEVAREDGNLSTLLHGLVTRRISSNDNQDKSRPYIYYGCAPHIPSPYFKLVDALLLPARAIPLSVQQKASLFDCIPSVVYLNNEIGWGVISGTVISKDNLLFAYFGEFISSSETTSRHAKNDRDKAMNYILTIREHIPASETICGGVLVSNIDASNFGSLGRFVNHSCDPNTRVVMMREQGAVVGIPVLKSLRTIAPGEQITFNYGGSEVETAPTVDESSSGESTVLDKRHISPLVNTENSNIVTRKRCLCGAARCSGFLPLQSIS